MEQKHLTKYSISLDYTPASTTCEVDITFTMIAGAFQTNDRVGAHVLWKISNA